MVEHLSVPSVSAPTSEPESRVERKRREARERIIQSAEQLMRSRPVDEVTVGDITQAADVGHGTFYLHFSSKHEVLIPITRNMAQRWDDAIQGATAHIQDPAEVVGHSARYMGRAVIADPLWRWMLQHSGVPIHDIRNAIGRFAARDFGRGLTSGRFQLTDLATANSFLIGGFVSCLLSSFDADDPEATIDQMAELLLRSLGVEPGDAARITRQPLPPLTTLNG